MDGPWNDYAAAVVAPDGPWNDYAPKTPRDRAGVGTQALRPAAASPSRRVAEGFEDLQQAPAAARPAPGPGGIRPPTPVDEYGRDIVGGSAADNAASYDAAARVVAAFPPFKQAADFARGFKTSMDIVGGRYGRMEDNPEAFVQAAAGLTQGAMTGAMPSAVKGAVGALGGRPSANRRGFPAEGAPPEMHVDLGPFEHDPNKPLGAQAQRYILDRGLETGVEHLLAIDANGDIVGHGFGTSDSTGMTPQLEAALLDPENAIVVHHNHPGNTSLSPSDVATLAAPGLHALWVHGHGGMVYRGELTPAAKAVLQRDPDVGYQKLHDVVSDAADAIYDQLTHAADRGMISAVEAAAARNHIVNMILREAGILDYQTNFDAAPLVAKAELQPYIEHAARKAERSVFDESQDIVHEARADDRRAGDFRHPGDVGAVFEDVGESPGLDAQASVDRVGQEDDSQEAVRLGRKPHGLEEAEASPAEDGSQLGPAAQAFRRQQARRSPADARERAAGLLRRFGYGDDDIAAMTPERRAAQAAQAVESGISTARGDGSGTADEPPKPLTPDVSGKLRSEVEGLIREVHGEAHPDDVALAGMLMHRHGLDAHDAFEHATLVNALRAGDISPGQMASVIGKDKTDALRQAALLVGELRPSEPAGAA